VGPTLGRALEAIGYDRDIDNLQEVRRGAGVTDPAALIAVPTFLAVATSSTVSREWRADGREMHHVPDPLRGLPVSRDWRSATVVAPDCVTAHTWSTAALVEGTGATETLGELGYPARLVSADRTVRLLGGWPRDAELGPIAAGGL
jgi:thiamine biosynthesis lipoprotein